MHEPVALTLPPGSTSVEFARLLDHELGFVAGPEGNVGRTWYDTMDWRLFDAGLVLEHEVVDAEPPAPRAFLRVRRLGRPVPEVELALDVVPAEVGELPARVAALLKGSLGNRAVLARCGAQGRARILRLSDGEGKAVLRIVLAEDSARPVAGESFAHEPTADGHVAGDVRPGTGNTVTLPPSLVLAPVRGHVAEFDGVRARLASLGCRPAPDLLEVAATALALEPGTDPSRFVVDVPADASAAEALRRLLGRLLRIMVVNEAGVRDDLDIEFLHDFRVAVRRARSIVQAAKGVMPPDRREWLAQELRWLGQVTTPVRDLDVTIEELEQDDPTLEPWQADLAPVHDVLADLRVEGLAALTDALASDRYRRFVAEARRFVASDWGDPDQDAVPFVQGRVKRAHHTVMRLGRQASSPEEWHEVRKAAKKLRYLLEGFRALLPPKATSDAVSSLKRFQEVLGAMQDAVVHVELARAAAAALVEQRATPAQYMAVGALIEQQLQRGRDAYARCAERFDRFAGDESKRRFKALWHQADEDPPATEPPEPPAATLAPTPGP